MQDGLVSLVSIDAIAFFLVCRLLEHPTSGSAILDNKESQVR